MGQFVSLNFCAGFLSFCLVLLTGIMMADMPHGTATLPVLGPDVTILPFPLLGDKPSSGPRSYTRLIPAWPELIIRLWHLIVRLS